MAKEIHYRTQFKGRGEKSWHYDDVTMPWNRIRDMDKIRRVFLRQCRQFPNVHHRMVRVVVEEVAECREDVFCPAWYLERLKRQAARKKKS